MTRNFTGRIEKLEAKVAPPWTQPPVLTQIFRDDGSKIRDQWSGPIIPGQPFDVVRIRFVKPGSPFTHSPPPGWPA